MVSRHPAKFVGHKYCVSGYMLLVVEEQDLTCSHLNLPLLLISKRRDLKAHSMSY